MKKAFGIIIISLILLAFGINYVYGQEVHVEKVVLQDNVHVAVDNEKQVNVKMEELNLKLPEGEYFSPGFYVGDEVYGDVNIDCGTIQSREEFPVNGTMKSSLYRVGNDNNITETEKQVFTNVYSSKVIGYGNHNNEGKIYSMDYLKDQEPQVMEDLTNFIKVNKYDRNNIFISEQKIDENKTFLKISTILPYRGVYIYLYDVENKRFFSEKDDKPCEYDFNYSKALNAFFYIDKNLVINKVVFEADKFNFDEYMDLKPYFKDSIDLASISGIHYNTLTDDEILITILGKFRSDGYFSFHPINETKNISILNLKTNQLREIFKADETKHIDSMLVDEFKTLGGFLLVFNEYEESNGTLIAKERVFKLLNAEELKTVFSEDITNEGATFSPSVRIKVKEDESELFLAKSVTILKDNIETTQKVIYKRYSFE